MEVTGLAALKDLRREKNLFLHRYVTQGGEGIRDVRGGGTGLYFLHGPNICRTQSIYVLIFYFLFYFKF